MKVLLLKQVPKLGRAGDIKEVAEGYARNYLLPGRLAVAADAEKINQWQARTQRHQTHAAVTAAQTAKLARRVRELKISLSATANEHGHLFAQVRPEEVIQEISRQVSGVGQLSAELPVIKAVGTYQGRVKLPGGESVVINVEIKAKT